MKVGQLIFRHEGLAWNCYYGFPETPESTIYLGSVVYAAVANNQARQEQFARLMRKVIADLIKETGGAGTAARPNS